MKPARFHANSPLDRLRRRRGVALSAVRGGGGGRAFSEAEQRLLKTLVSGDQDYIDNPAFYAKDAERRIYDEAPPVKKPDASWYHPVMDDLNLGRGRLPKTSEQVILTGAEEKVLFLQFNYARFRIARIQDEVRASETGKPAHEQCEALLRWYTKADDLREQIAETNLALVLAMAKRTRMSEVDFADLVSEGNMALLRAVDKFDCERGFKFSTYACRAILKAFSRQGMKLSKYRQRFPTDFDPKLERSNHLEVKRGEFETDAAAEVKRLVTENRCDLTDIERTVIEHRFRLESPDPDEKPMTLEQVGQIIGVTKERVRQIQNKALEKIRIELEHQFMGKPKPETPEGEASDPEESALLTAQASLN
jgi:RNA polymerase sigma factor (sigma-70 family)